ncbi:RNA polymerase sigma factor [Algibacillus agarilyticus]|uniref:RNA polymerase sigma factor n=1 Tax=Algibacillus agarilyticus TaxID=2234133 RepID=UPI000DD08D19|nr:RNA polymerase sigma factor [Algibacillus agarilyticus]
MNQVLSFFIKSGNKHAFEATLAPHMDALFKVAYQYTGQKSDAEDLIQDLLIDLYADQAKLNQVKTLKPWLMRCLYNKFIDQCRRDKKQKMNDSLEQSNIENLTARQHHHDESVMHQQVLIGLQTLSHNQRAIVSLHDIEGYSLVELSQIMDKPVGTLKSDLHRARTKLKNYLKLQPSDVAIRQCQ